MYKAKGKGEKREIWDGSTLVGRWKAVWPDGSPVRDKDSKETVMPTIKAWKQPSTWAERKGQ